MFKKLNKDQDKKLYKAILELERINPEIFYFLKDCSIKVSEKIPTALATFDKNEKKFCICISENWLNDFDLFNLAAITEHELHHIILSHLFSKKEDHHLANIAQDAIINDLAHSFRDKKKLNEALSRGVFMSDVSRNLKEKKILGDYEELNLKTHNSDKIYEFLKLLPESKTKNWSTIDQHDSLDKDLKDAGMESIEKSPVAQQILKELFDTDKKETKEALQKIGKESAEFEIFFAELDKKKRIKNFKSNILKSLSSNRDIKTKASIKRPSRRFDSPIGKQKIKKQKIKFCLDLSGSMMSDETKEKMRIALNTAHSLGFEIDLLGGDTKKTLDVKNVKPSFNFSDIKGGGGTMLNFFFEDWQKVNCSYVILTDGFFSITDIPAEIKKNKVLFLSTEQDVIGDFKVLKI